MEEIVEEILEQGGLFEAKINSIHYCVEHDVSKEKFKEIFIAKGPS